MSALKKFWLEFIDLYKSLPELWKMSSEEYTNRALRNKAYEIMLEKYHEIDKDANVYTVKKRINNIRTAFRRELNRLRRSELEATCPQDIYKPTLWYFKNLEFLIEEGEEENADGGDTTMGAMEDASVIEEQTQPSPPKNQYQSKKRKSTVLAHNEQSPQLPPSPKQHEQEIQIQQPMKKDKAEAISGAWEVQYRELENRQQLYANRMINEILYQAALGKLQEKSYKVLEQIIEEPNGDVGHYSPERVTETQYYLAESSEDIEEQLLKEQEIELKDDIIKKEFQRKKQIRSSK